MHPPQQATPQPPSIPGQHVSQGPVMTMAYFVQQPQQTYPTPHAQQTIGNNIYLKFSIKQSVYYMTFFQLTQVLQWE